MVRPLFRVPSSLSPAIVLAALAGQAAAQVFTGAAPPSTPGQPFDWFAIRDTGSVCGGPSDHVLLNNWSAQWCSNTPTPAFPSGAVNLNGFDVTCFQDAATLSVLNPVGGLLRLGAGTQSFGTLNNQGSALIARGLIGNSIHSTVINNTGTFTDFGGGNGTNVGNITFNNFGTLSNGGGSFDMIPAPGQPWSGTCTLTNNSGAVVESVTSGANTGSGAFPNWVVHNNGTIRTLAGCGLNFSGCEIHSAGTWNTGAGTIGNGMDINGCSLQGVFTGTTANDSGIRFNGTITFPEDTTLNIGGNGVYRWVGPTFTIAPGKTLTNAGTMNIIGPHTHPTSGAIVNTGIVNQGGNVRLDGGTYTNSATGVYTLSSGVFTATAPHTLVNHGLLRGSSTGNAMNGIVFQNTGTVLSEAAGNLNFSSCAITSSGTWNTGAGNTGNGMDFFNCSLQGTFTGSTANDGGFRFDGAITFPEDTTLNFSGNGAYRWVGPSFTIAPGKTLTNAGTLNIIGPHTHPTSGTFLNTGVINQGGTVRLDGGTYTNAAGATCTITSGGFSATAAHSLVNDGTMWAGNGGANFSGVSFRTTGSVRNNATNGTGFTFGGCDITSTASATWSTSPTSDGFDFSSSTIRGPFNGTTTDTNDWRLNGTITVADDTTLHVTGGGLTRWVCSSITIAPGKTLTNTGVLGNLNGCTLQGAMVNNGELDYYNGSSTFAGHTLVNNGVINWYSHDFNAAAGGGTFTNNGTITVMPNTSSGVHVSTVNNSLISIGSAAGSASWGSTINTLVQTATGVVRLTSPTEPTSTLNVPANSTLSGGTIEGNGAVAVDFLGTSNFGSVLLDANQRAAGSGRLQLRGSANFSPNTRTRVRIDGPGPNDRTSIDCWRTLSLHGTLEVAFPAEFIPTIGTTWTIASAQTRIGTFDSVVLLGSDPEVQVAVGYSPTAVTVTITHTTCDSIDFNHDTLFPDTQDITDFLSVFSGGVCDGQLPSDPACNTDIDFNNDSLYPDTDDISALLRVFSGGPCT
mgnify:CR=1 FL=1